MRERAEAKRARLIEAGFPERTRDAQFGGPSKASLSKRVGNAAVWEEMAGDARTGLRAAPAHGEAEQASTWWWAVSKPTARPRPDTDVTLVRVGDGARITLRLERVSCGTMDSARISASRRASGMMTAVVMAKPKARPRPAAADVAISAEVASAFASAKDVFLEL